MMMGSHILKFFSFPAAWKALRCLSFANTMQKCHPGIGLMLLVRSVLEVATCTEPDGEGLAGLRFPLLSSPHFSFSSPHTFLQMHLAKYAAARLCAGQPSEVRVGK